MVLHSCILIVYINHLKVNTSKVAVFSDKRFEQVRCLLYDVAGAKNFKE